jgi:hypothetical protein
MACEHQTVCWECDKKKLDAQKKKRSGQNNIQKKTELKNKKTKNG